MIEILQEGECLYMGERVPYSVGIDSDDVVVLRIGKEKFRFNSDEGVEDSLWIAQIYMNLHAREA